MRLIHLQGKLQFNTLQHDAPTVIQLRLLRVYLFMNHHMGGNANKPKYSSRDSRILCSLTVGHITAACKMLFRYCATEKKLIKKELSFSCGCFPNVRKYQKVFKFWMLLKPVSILKPTSMQLTFNNSVVKQYGNAVFLCDTCVRCTAVAVHLK